MKKTRSGFCVLFVVIIGFSLYLALPMVFANISDYVDNTHLIHSSSNIVFDFNSTYTIQNYSIELTNIHLSDLNCFSFCFLIIGDTSNDDGLKVTFVFNETMVGFEIPLIWQDNNEHNLTQQFTYSDCFIELFSFTIICEGQANSEESGSLVILETSICPFNPPILDEDLMHFPIFPNWLSFQGSLKNPQSKFVMSSASEYP